MKILIDDNLVFEDGCRGMTYIEYPDAVPEQCRITDPQVLALELQYAPIQGVMGYRLTQEKELADGSMEVVQEFWLPPDTAYALYAHWREMDG